MTTSFTRKALLPAILTAMLLPVSMGALAGEKAADEPHGPDHAGPRGEHMEVLFDRADIDDETREALRQAGIEHHDAMEQLNADYRDQRQQILGEEGVSALEQAGKELREERLTTLMDEWQLSDEDRASLQQTREGFHESIQSLRARDFESREARRQAWNELRETTHASLAEVLSEEQIDELKHTMMPDHGRGDRGPHGHHHGDRHGEAQHSES